jgi:hypothetical protein
MYEIIFLKTYNFLKYFGYSRRMKASAIIALFITMDIFFAIVIASYFIKSETIHDFMNSFACSIFLGLLLICLYVVNYFILFTSKRRDLLIEKYQNKSLRKIQYIILIIGFYFSPILLISLIVNLNKWFG